MKIFNQLNKLLNHPLNKNRKVNTILRITWWKFNQLYFKIPAVVEMTKNAKLICYPNNSYGSFVVYANFPEYEELNFLHQVIHDGDIVIDVGANIGSESVLAASKGQNVKVFAFEPTDSLVPLLEENRAINGFFDRIEIIKKAVSNNNGKTQFVLETESEINHIATTNSNGKKTKDVDCLTLDSFTKNTGIKKINFLKIDVEGAELLVLQGAKNLLAEKRIDLILFELNKNLSNFNATPEDIFTVLRSNNYFIFQFNKNGMLELLNKNFSLTKTINLVAIQKSPAVIKNLINFLK